MEIKEFIESLKTSDFSLIVENDKLVLKASGQNDINEIRKNDFVINYIKENKNEIIRYLSRTVTDDNGGSRQSSKNISAIYPLSSLQQAMLFHGLYDEGSGVYIEQFSCDIIGLELPAFEESWKHVLKNHTILRSAFYYDDFNIPVQAVYREVKLPLQVFDYRHLTDEQQENAQRQYEDNDRNQGFNFKAAPLFRIAILRLTDDRYRMLWTWHHILFDGWSTPILMEELLTTYQSIVKGKEILKRAEDRYEEFIRYLDRINKGEEERYWREYMKGLDQSVLLPFINNTKERNKGIGDYKSVSLELDSETTQKLERYAKKSRVTVNTVMQAIWAYLLSQYTGNQNVVFGVIVSGRPDDLPLIDTRVGLFINTLPLNTLVQDERELATWLEDIQAQQAASRHYQHTPLQNIQRWTGIHGDLFDSLLVFENYPVSKFLSSAQFDLQIENVRMREQTNYPLNVIISAADEINIKFLFNSALLDEVYVELIRGHFQHVLSQILHHSINTPGDIRLLTQPEEAQLLLDFNDTKVENPANIGIPDLFEAQVEKTPDETAVVFGGLNLDYRTLNELSNQLAHYLKSRGVRPDVLVPICVERSLEMVIGVLAILKAGGAYVPIDPEYPAERIHYMLEDIGSRIVLCTKSTKTILTGNATIALLEIDRAQGAIKREPTTNLQLKADPNALAYVLFTSGSTGRPKGVEMSSVSLVNLLNWQEKQFQNKHRRVLQFANLNFDVSFQEIFSTICYGSTLYLLNGDRRKNLSLVLEEISNQKITHLFIPFIVLKSLSELILQEPTTSLFLEEIITAGEQLKLTEEIQTLLDERKITLINQYGPTEAHVVSSYIVNRQSGSLPPIGKPIDNTSLYVLNEKHSLIPVGVIGELYIGGVQVARGYLNRPGLTAEKFINDPFAREQRGMMYRTGDLARWLPDGNLEYFGRIDHQVKIRGYRVELGEIESVLQQHESVSQAVVVANTDGAGNNRLVAYVVPARSFIRSTVIAYLKQQLPDHMIPALWVEIDSIPLTSNGKADRKALPSPEVGGANSKPYTPPHNEFEQALAGIWQQLLEIETVGIEDDFFELGGHSLLAIRVISAIRKQLNLEVSIKDLFVHTTVASLAAHLSRTSKGWSLPTITAEPRPEILPLSFSQERLWFIDRLEGSVAYHIPIVLSLKGKLNIQALSNAFRELLQRHEVLRTVIRERAEQACQVINAVDEWSLSVVEDATYQKSPEALRKHIHDLIGRPFDLANDYMLRAALIRLTDDENILVVTIHHIATDGWSMPIIVTDLAEFYRANVEAREPKLQPLKLQFADYALWQRLHLSENVLIQKLEYWKQKLDGGSPLQLPTDYKRPAVQSTIGDLETFVIDSELTSALKKLSNQQGTTLYMTLLAAFNVLLYRYSGQHDICIGSPIANRTRQEIEGLVGFFVNSIAFRNNLDSHQTFLELLQQVKTTTLEAYEHQDIPFEKVVEAVVKERDLTRSPIFQIMFVLQNTPQIPSLELGELSLSPVDHEHSVSKFDLSFFISEKANGLEASVEYATALYSRGTIQRMIGHFKQLLTSIVKIPRQPVGRLPMLTAAEELRLIRDFNDTALPYSPAKSLVDLFGESAVAKPDAVAIVFEKEELTYRKLDELSNQVAWHLKSKGAKTETLIPICIERSTKMIVGILGILKAGAAYVPIDPEYPEDRINYIISDAEASLFVSSKKVLSLLGGISHVEVVDFDNDWSAITSLPTTFPRTNIQQNQLAYVIYTSGSTGKPKGVMIEHGNLMSYLLNNKTRYVDLENTNSGSFVHLSYTFDASITAMFMPLLFGKSVVVGSKQSVDVFEDPNLRKYAPYDFIKITPAHLELLQPKMRTDDGGLLTGKLVIGGEALFMSHINSFVKDGMDVDLINEYGPTEATVGCSVYHFKTLGENYYNKNDVSIGKPIDNVNIYILDSDLNLLPPGIKGEIFIAGAGVARGYLNNDKLTAEKFVANPFGITSGARMYRTGDFGRWLPDGNIEYVGRLDDQVKIRGYRIEPVEIETVLQESEMVHQAVVMVKEDLAQNRRLVGYVVPKEIFDRESLVGYLKNKLPEYMIPALWVELAQFPLTSNGKIDRKKLPDPDISSLQTAEYVAPRNKVEKVLAGIWQEVLGVEQVGIYDNFFELGGDSIVTIQVVSRSVRLGYELEPKDIFIHQTIARLSEAIADRSSAVASGEQGHLTGECGLLPVQQWYFEGDGAAISHYNHGILLGIDKAVTVENLDSAVEQLMEYHDALRFRYHYLQGHWYQEYGTNTGGLITLDLNSVQDSSLDCVIRKHADHYQQSLNIEKGILIRVVLMQTPERETHNRLLIVVHHLAIDGVSWRILLDDLELLLTGLQENKKTGLGHKGSSYRQWYEALRHYGQSLRALSQRPHWEQVVNSYKPLAIDKAYRGEIREKDIDKYTVHLDAVQTRLLLHEVGRVYHTEINDILMCALAMTICDRNAIEKVVIGLEGHGREKIAGSIDTSRTVGWFTSLYPVLLEVKSAWSVADAIKGVKEQLRKIPEKGLGYGVLRYINKEEALQGKSCWDIVFNYLGQLDHVISGGKWLVEATESAGAFIGDEHAIREQLSINSLIKDGQLILNWNYSNRHYEKETVMSLAADYVSKLESLITHCTQHQNIGVVYTPSDYGLGSEVNFDELDSFLNEEL